MTHLDRKSHEYNLMYKYKTFSAKKKCSTISGFPLSHRNLRYKLDYNGYTRTSR